MSALSVVASGMVSAVGNSAPASLAALRAGVRGISEGNIWDWTAGKNLGVGRPTLHQWWEGRELLAELIAPAIDECLTVAEESLRISREVIPIVLIVAARGRPARPLDLDREVLGDLAHKLGRALPRGSLLITEGRTGIARALEHAQALIAAAHCQACVIAGAESFLRQSIADHYTFDEPRLLTAANSNGFSLGEAAAAVLVADSGRCRGPRLTITGSAQAHDPSGAGGTPQHPADGAGLTAAIRGALQRAGIDHSAIDLRVSDANGEHWKFKEVSIASVRLDRPRASGAPPHRFGFLDHWHPIEYVGEVGAAIGPMLLAWTLHAGVFGYLHGPRVLVHASEDNGDRMALVTEYSVR